MGAIVSGRRRGGPGGPVTSTPGPPRRMPRCSPSDRSNDPTNRFAIDRTALRTLGFRLSVPSFDVCDTRPSRVPVRSGESYAARFCLGSIGSIPRQTPAYINSIEHIMNGLTTNPYHSSRALRSIQWILAIPHRPPLQRYPISQSHVHTRRTL